MLKRVLTAIPALLLLAAAVALHGVYLLILLCILSVVLQHEVIAAAAKGGKQTCEILLYVAAAFTLPAYIFFNWTGILILFAVFAFAVCIAAVLAKKPSVEKTALTVALYVYPQFFLLFLAAMAMEENADASRLMIILLFAVAILTDTFAYFTGMALGKKKLSPYLSPNKTIAGAAGGLAGGVLAALCIGLFIQGLFGVRAALLHYLALGFIMSILSQVGDLFASFLKREFGVKDYGSILPGHGGMLDRLDSAIFIAPVVYFYFNCIVQINA